MKVSNLQSIRIKLASPEEILQWSHGEVTKPETINYRTQKTEKDGLFCEKIFGPSKDFECYCGKYKGLRYKGMVCDRCGVEITKSSVRRERMGHIKLACPCSHIWFLRGLPSRMGQVLSLPTLQLERVIYFAAYIITKVDEEGKKKILEEIELEYQGKIKSKEKTELTELKEARDRARQEVLGIKMGRVLFEKDYYDFSLKYGLVFEAGTGAETLRKIFSQINLKEIIKKLKKDSEEAGSEQRKKIFSRLRLFQGMLKAGVRPESMFLAVLPILPPELRPMVQLDGGRYASSDLNDLYRRVINRNNRLKYLLEIGSPEVIVRNEKRMLQEAVDALIDNSMRKGITTTATTGGRRLLKSLADMLKGKQGRFRQNLLGKRVDYSARSVIVVGPKLKINQVGLPKKMALELFKPFVLSKILAKELAYNVRASARLIEEETDEVWAILEEVVKDKVVLLNRAPTLHRLSVQAFYPILIEGEAIRLHPMVCKAFNADFDGDQMAVHLPLSSTSQKESKEKMLAGKNLFKPATGTPVVTLYQDIVLGCYYLTKILAKAKGEGKLFSSPEEAILAYEFGFVNLKAKIKVCLSDTISALTETSVGRIIFNEALPKDFPFQNIMIKDKTLEHIVGEIINTHKSEVVDEILDKIKELGFEYSTISGITWGMNDLIVPPQKPKILAEAEKKVETIKKHFNQGLLSREEKSAKVIEVWSNAKIEIEELVPKTLPENDSVFQMIDAGARGSWAQPVQMAGMKGLVVNPGGQIIEMPVKSSYKEGFEVLEYFISTHGARKGTTDTALRTSSAGYLTRRLVDVAHEQIISQTDCGDKEGVVLSRKAAEEIGQNFLFKIIGRTSLEDIKGIIKKGEIIDWQKGRKILRAEIAKVRVRSPLSCCAERGICQKCYGWDLGYNKEIKLGEAVGIVAAQSIGEPGTQLTLRTFHTGGVAGGGDITVGLPRVQEVFEARMPKGKAELCQVEGKVISVKEGVIKIKAKSENKKQKITTEKLKVKSKKEKKKKEEEEIVEYEVPKNTAVLVKAGQSVVKGQQLWEGSLDIKELFKYGGQDAAQQYILKEIQRIYTSQGAHIHDKHLEVIIRQMFSRLKIKEPGDSLFSPGEIVERAKFLEENGQLKKEKKALATAKPVLLGISGVSLTTDSFLSAASFQETSKVLIKASLTGKEDKLRGLKENVIIGKLIPVGEIVRK